MSPAELDEIFLNMRAAKARLKKTLLALCVVAAILGLVLLLFTDAKALTYMFITAAVLLLLFIPLLHYDDTASYKKAVQIRDTLATQPKELVWMYTRQVIRKNRIRAILVVIHLRDGQTVDINKDTLPGQDENAFMIRMRDTYNPNCIIGYSDEVNQRYKAGML